MSVLKKTLSSVVAALFPNSVQAVSESLNTEQFNAFAGDAEEVNNRLEAQATGNEGAVNDLKAAQARIVELEGQVTAGATAATRVTELEGAVGGLTAALAVFGATEEDRATYKAQADLALKQAENLRKAGVPASTDASTDGQTVARSYENAPWNQHVQVA